MSDNVWSQQRADVLQGKGLDRTVGLDAAWDDRAVVLAPQGSPWGAPFDARGEFVARYGTIREALSKCRSLGVLIAAFDESLIPIGMTWLSAPHETCARVIGRHAVTDVRIPDSHQDISLRHLLVLARVIGIDEVRLRVVDLNTPCGFFDEQGRALRGLVAEGSIFLSIGRVRLMLLVTDPANPLPDDANDAFECIPERVFINERAGLETPLASQQAARQKVGIRAGSGVAFDHSEAMADRMTWVSESAAPVRCHEHLAAPGDELAGVLRMRQEGETRTFDIAAGALKRGILIGRYERCELQLQTGAYTRASRSHLLLVEHEGDVLAVDLASTNGSLKNGNPFRVTCLRSGDRCVLGNEVELTWTQNVLRP